MKLQYFGDSYDIVKNSLMAALKSFGPWVTHPMFTERFTKNDAAAFARLIGTDLVSTQVLTPYTDREEYFSACESAVNLFLDPDTGVHSRRRGGKTSVQYVFADELVRWCRARPKHLTLIFDQSYSRGHQDEVMQDKLRHFAGCGISGLVYDSHATFLLLAANRKLLMRARKRLIERPGLPERRLVLSKEF